jgi:hypothetical protein
MRADYKPVEVDSRAAPEREQERHFFPDSRRLEEIPAFRTNQQHDSRDPFQA